MNMNAATRALVWKEIRLAMPLVWMVFALGVVLNFFGLLGSHVFEPAFVAVSMIFSTGIGVLLVGNEKDQRTLSWCQSLPVSPRTISKIKFAITLGSIAVVWLLSFLLQWLLWQMVNNSLWFQSPFWVDLRLNPSAMFAFPLTSLFLGLAGLAAAWHLRSSLYALLVLIPICLLLFAFSQGVARVLVQDSSRVDPSGWVYACVLGIASIAAGWYGWRASLEALGPAAAPRPETQQLAWWPVSSRVSSSASASPAIPLHALGWQMMAQNRGLWLSLSAILILAVGMTSDSPHADPLPHPWLDYMGMLGQLFLLAIWVGVCILGCSVFLGDNMQQRVRFLADRGVSPSRVWWTRQWIPLLILVGICFVRMGFRAITGNSVDRMPQLLLWDFCRCLCFGTALYVVSQWVAQCVPSTILSVCVAPLFTFGMMLYAMFATHSFEAPWWTLGLSLVILLLATYWQTKPWMDRALGIRYYMTHGLFLMLACVIPLLPGIWKIATLPQMPSEVRTALESEWEDLRARVSRALPDFRQAMLLSDEYTVAETLNQARETLTGNIAKREQGSTAAFMSRDIPVFLDRQGLTLYLSELASSRERFDQEPIDANRELYRRMVESTLDAIEMLRDTYTLRSLDVAEYLELALLLDMRRPTIASDLGEPLYQNATKLLSDSQARDAVRRASLAYEYHSAKTRRVVYGPMIGGYSLEGDYSGSLIGYYRNRSLPDRVATDLWRLLQLRPGKEASEANRQIAESYRTMYRLGGEVAPEYVWVPSDGWRVGPGSLWRGEWEREAAALASTLQSTSRKE